MKDQPWSVLIQKPVSHIDPKGPTYIGFIWDLYRVCMGLYTEKIGFTQGYNYRDGTPSNGK